MKQTIFGFRSALGKEFFTLIFLLVVHISCSKEYSYEGGFIPEPISIFINETPSGQTMNDKMGGIEIGVKFRSTRDGNVQGIKFYKTPNNTGTHTVQLYS